MPILHVRQVPDDLYARLKYLASKNKRSITAQTIVLLEKAIKIDTSLSPLEAYTEAKKLTAKLNLSKLNPVKEISKQRKRRMRKLKETVL